MPSESELLNDITKITNAIQQHRQAQQYQQRPRPSSSYQYSSSIRPGYPTGHYNHSTLRGRGRGRGSTNLSLRPSSPAPSMQYVRPAAESFNKTAYRPNPTHNKTLVLNNTNPTNPTPSMQPPPLLQPTSYRPVISTPRPFQNKTLSNSLGSGSTRPSSAVPRRYQGLNRTLVMNNSNNTVASSSSPATLLARPGRNKKLVIRDPKTADRFKRYINSNGQQVVEIDGVPFINMGKRLVRQDIHGQRTVSSTPRVLIRRLVKRRDKNQNMVLGKRRRDYGMPNDSAAQRPRLEGYERHGSRTLVRSTVTNKDPRRRSGKKQTYCGTFTRYGTCPKGPRCKFIHDPKHVAICIRFLVSGSQKKCPQGAHCPLSHDPTPHNTPHCRHFQRIKCTNEDCPFAHVRVRPDAPLCRAFGVEGYCPKGLACKDLHVIVCPTFAVLGKCTKPGCKLPHVSPSYKPKAPTSTTTTAATTSTNTSTKDDSKVNFGKQQWIRPGLENTFEQQRQKQKNMPRPPPPTPAPTPLETNKATKDMDDMKEDGFVPLFGDDDDEDDADWNQYLIKNPEDVEEIKSLRFSDETEPVDEQGGDDDNDGSDQDDDYNDNSDRDDDGNDNSDQDDDTRQEDDFVYEEVLDEDDDMGGDDSSVEEIYEEASDLEDD